jgi:hypothetical protein
LLVLVLVLSFTYPVQAQRSGQEEQAPIVDARLEGYEQRVTLDDGGVGLVWMVFILLGAICLGALFKDARRTHLD